MSVVCLNVSAQDVIVKRNGDELQCKILEVSKSEVKFKRWSNQDGPTYTEKKADIFMLKYENGEKEEVAYESPEATPSSYVTTSSEFIFSEPAPISNVYLDYTSHGKRESGILKWGHMQSIEQAQNILTNDWAEYSKARKGERTGKALAITGGIVLTGGLFWTFVHIMDCKNYSNAKKEYEENDFYARINYNAKVRNLLENMNASKSSLIEAKAEYEKAEASEISWKQVYNKAKKDYENGLIPYEDVSAAYQNYYEYSLIREEKEKEYEKIETESSNYTAEYEHYITDNSNYQNSEFYFYNYQWHLEDCKRYKKTSLYPMIGGLTIGTAMFVVGIIKAKREHKNVTGILNKYNEEYENNKKVGMFKPEFNVNSNGNNIAFTLTF